MALLEEKVGYRHFYWVLGVGLTVIMSVLAFQVGLILRVDDKVDRGAVQQNQSSTEIIGEVAELKGQLKNLDFVNE